MDLEYLEELHDAHNSYPLAPEKKVIKISRSRAGSAPGEQRENGSDLEDKENYAVHYKNLQFYLRQGMRLERVNRAIEFDQVPWMAPYMRMNTEFREQAKSDFDTNFYKMMNNSVFGRTMVFGKTMLFTEGRNISLESLSRRAELRFQQGDDFNHRRKAELSVQQSHDFSHSISKGCRRENTRWEKLRSFRFAISCLRATRESSPAYSSKIAFVVLADGV